MNDLRRVAVASRVFTLAVIASAALVGNVALGGVYLVLGVALLAEWASLTRVVPERLIAVLEGALTAVAVALAYPANEAALPYLATPVLIGGVAGGFTWTVFVLVAEGAALVASWIPIVGGYESGTAGSVVTWLTTGLGLGLLGTFTRDSVTRSTSDSSYRSALDLIKQLHALSGSLTSGLDPVDLADQAVEVVSAKVVVRQAVVVVRQGSSFTPLRFAHGAMGYPLDDADQLLHKAWSTRQPVLGGARVALPMSTETERVAVILVDCATMPDTKVLDSVMVDLGPSTLRLQAALLFSAVRDTATSEERHRLAREVHDGVAQDVASLGYLVDNLAASVSTEEQQHDVAVLRREVTRVVAELRNSVFDLRNEPAAGQGLGQSIATFARHVGSHSPLTVHVTLDESATRLRPRVEAELLRITQEAINNARRHSGAENLWVNCRVHPPRAEIDVIDDGDGLGSPRDDSHGLRIMQERADRAGATLSVISPANAGRGTRISLRLD
ncbi:MAG: sensor histidine kinase [Marmoricola sp.]